MLEKPARRVLNFVMPIGGSDNRPSGEAYGAMVDDHPLGVGNVMRVTDISYLYRTLYICGQRAGSLRCHPNRKFGQRVRPPSCRAAR